MKGQILFNKIIGAPPDLGFTRDVQNNPLFQYQHALIGDISAAGRLIEMAQQPEDWRAQTESILLLFALWKSRPATLGGSILAAIETALPAPLRLGDLTEKRYLRDALSRLFPKVELHTHLDGSVRVPHIAEMAERQRIDLRTAIPELPVGYTLDDIRRYAVLGDENTGEDFERFLIQRFALPLSVLQTASGLELAAFYLVEQAYRDGVLHIEARFAPVIHQRNHLRYDEIIDAVYRGLKRGEKYFGVTSSIILCLYRNLASVFPNHFELTAKAAIDAAARYGDTMGVGIDIAGKEIGFPPKEARYAYWMTRNTPVFRTVHAGEMSHTLHYVEQAMVYLRPHRIGHGNQLVSALDGGEGAMEVFLRLLEGVTLELCPTSNVQLKSTEGGLVNHPLFRLHRAGFKVTINPDNRTISETSMTDEFSRVVEYTGMPFRSGDHFSGDMVAMTHNAVHAAFMSEGRRLELNARVSEALSHLHKIVSIVSPYL